MRLSQMVTGIAVIFLTVNLFSEERSNSFRIAILDFSTPKNIKEIAEFSNSLITEKLFLTGKFVLVERSQMELILKEQGFQHTGCTDNSCAVKLGRILSVHKIILGSMNEMEGYHLSLKLIDVESGTIDATFSAIAKTKKDVDGACGELARKIYERYFGEGVNAWEYYLRSIVPGWSQVYAGHEIKGYTLFGAFVFSGIFMGYSIFDFREKRREYENLAKGTPQSTFDDKYSESQNALKTARISIGIFTAVYAIHLVDMLLFSRPTVMYGMDNGDTQIHEENFFSIQHYYEWAHDISEKRVMMSISKKF